MIKNMESVNAKLDRIDNGMAFLHVEINNEWYELPWSLDLLPSIESGTVFQMTLSKQGEEIIHEQPREHKGLDNYDEKLNLLKELIS